LSGDARGGLPVLSFASADSFEAWLEDEHASSAGIWLRFAKKASGVASVTAPEAVEAALCFGWIDGQLAPLDERFWLVRFTPRGKRSKWSRRNRELAGALIAAGRMRPAGAAEIERAKADGRWEAAYPGQRTATVPADLQAALDANPQAAAFFERLDRGNRYAILYRVHDAKRPATRTRRIEQFVAMLAADEKIHP
jgi:uncharacterized protein YdeI (YjbR/CyaY-like superfamily)